MVGYSQVEAAGKSTVQLNFKNLGQLLDLDDPSPYPHKELTEVAEDAISSHLGDFPIKREVELVVSLPSGALNLEIQENLAETIRQHFNFRASEIALELVRKKSNVKFGLKAIAVMVAIMIPIGLAIKLLPDLHLFSSAVQLIIAGTITIIAWVVIGDTFKAYVIGYRDVERKMKVYEKAARMNIRIEQA